MERWRRYQHPQIYRASAPRPVPASAWLGRLSDWRPSRSHLWIVLGLVGIGSLGWLVFGSEIFKVRQVQAEGEITQELSVSLQSLVGQRIFFIKEGVVFQQLSELDPAVAELVVAKGFPDQIQVSVIRRHPALLWQTGDREWAIDPEGVAFPVDPTLTEGVPVVFDQRGLPIDPGKQILSKSFIQFTQNALVDLPKEIGGTIERVEVGETTLHLRFVTDKGWVIILDTTRPLGGQITNLRLVLNDYSDKVHEYIDLRLAGWAYIK